MKSSDILDFKYKEHLITGRLYEDSEKEYIFSFFYEGHVNLSLKYKYLYENKAVSVCEFIDSVGFEKYKEFENAKLDNHILSLNSIIIDDRVYIPKVIKFAGYYTINFELKNNKTIKAINSKGISYVELLMLVKNKYEIDISNYGIKDEYENKKNTCEYKTNKLIISKWDE